MFRRQNFCLFRSVKLSSSFEHRFINVVSITCTDSSQRLLLTQESKQEHAKKWYLPAGRMIQNESIENAAKREALEETGLIIEPLGVFAF